MNREDSISKEWNKVYHKTAGTWYPSEPIVKFVSRYLKRRVGINEWVIKNDVSKILDAGCGLGRNVLFLAECGYDAYGIDISSDAIDIARKFVEQKGLKAKFEVGSITTMPFEQEFFDVVISHEILDHLPFSDAKKAIEEIYRILKPEGYLYVSLRSSFDSEFGRGKEVDHNTFILEKGYEKGLIQHFFDQEEIKDLLSKFKIFNVEILEEKFPNEYTIDKAWLQSSQGLKKYFSLDKPLDMDLKYSRWHLIAEKI